MQTPPTCEEIGKWRKRTSEARDEELRNKDIRPLLQVKNLCCLSANGLKHYIRTWHNIPVVGPAGLSRKKICSRVKSKHYPLTGRCDCADCA
ncbi:uncharacterized protein IAS62_002966 [Cryptococcus decagattii]|uniref:Uncharacterized protein n=1 Tax=Cryptococcus decagattii TaxID=1859122 RepID=A0ABZ2AT04_9TREE